MFSTVAKGRATGYNRHMKLLLCVLLLITLTTPAQASQVPVLPVLVYHHIQLEVQSDVSCTPQQFKSQMQALLDHGFTLINLRQTRLFLAGALDSVEKPVLITFDDGYESLYHYALPVAEELKIPMTVFIITSRIGRQPQFASYLDESQIISMHKSGYFDFGSHTHDLHVDILRIYEAFTSSSINPVISLMRRDLRQSSDRLLSLTGERPSAIAWPYGKHNHETTQVARDEGFSMHFTSRYGYNEPGVNPFAIKRIPVSARDDQASVIRKATLR